MNVKIAAIADDFTGATDIAGFFADNGLTTVQVNGEDHEEPAFAALLQQAVEAGAEAIVVSLKNRSNPPDEAVAKALAVYEHLERQGVEQVYFKYCSTFDSTPQGNIGPVTDALMERLQTPITVVSPALPVNGRTVYQGYLFVDGVPLHESGMADHPLTPMTDSSLKRLMEGQSQGQAGVITADVIDQGPSAVVTRLKELEDDGMAYAITDTLTDRHLEILGEAFTELPLVTGGSGLGGGLARALGSGAPRARFGAPDLPAVVFAGSSSRMTNAQVKDYSHRAPSLAVDVVTLMSDPKEYQRKVLDWYREQDPSGPAPLIYATAAPDAVALVQQQYGVEEAGGTIEQFFGGLARSLAAEGVRYFIVAGGETSGAVSTALGVTGVEVGTQIAPGVPVVRSLDQRYYLALKSGNFGATSFFADALTGDTDA